MSNIFKTALLLAALTAILVLVGGAVGGRQGMVIAFVLALVMNVASYWYSDRIVLAMYRARPVDEAQAPRLHATVRRLAAQAGVPVPRVYIIPTATPICSSSTR